MSLIICWSSFDPSGFEQECQKATWINVSMRGIKRSSKTYKQTHQTITNCKGSSDIKSTTLPFSATSTSIFFSFFSKMFIKLFIRDRLICCEGLMGKMKYPKVPNNSQKVYYIILYFLVHY